MAIHPTSQRMDMRSRLSPGQYEPQLPLPPLLPSSPPEAVLHHQDPMQYPFRLACVNNMSPIHALPVELLTRIFQLGVDSEPIPDDRDHTALTFEVSISHVCRHWRQVALHTPLLWTTVHFRTKSHMFRGNVYLARNARLPIDIYVDTCSEDAHAHRKDLLFRDEFIPVFNIVLPHIDRWRELHLKVADLDCKLSARRVLSTCGPARALRTLQLWHVQNWQTPERLFTAIGPPPVVVFGGELPALKHIVLQGVNLPWMSSPFLRNLTSIEYALHSDDVRMPFPLWRKMLAASPALERLCLHYSGPRARASGAPTPDGIEWWGADPPGPGDAHTHGHQAPPAADPVRLPRLREVRLIDLEADYLVAVFKSIDAPNVRALHLELETEDQDFSPFVDFLAKQPGPSSLSLSLSAPQPPLNGHGHGAEDEGEADGDGYGYGYGNKHAHGHVPDPESGGAHGPLPQARFPRLETLSVSALVCGAGSWRALLASARALTRLEVDFVPPMHEGAFAVLFGTVRAERPRPRVRVRVRASVSGNVGGGASGSGGSGANGRNGADGRDERDGANERDGGGGSQSPMGPLPSGGRGEVGGMREAMAAEAEAEAEGGTRTEVRRRDKGKGRATDHDHEHAGHADHAEGEEGEYEEVPILPALREIRCAGVPSRELARLAAFRRTFRSRSCSGAGAGEEGEEGEGAFRIRRWEVEEGFRDEDGIAFERELERISEEALQERAQGGGSVAGAGAGEPWRWDEPLEKVVWFRDEGDYDDDEEEDDDGEESDGAEEVGDTEEDGDEDGEDA